MNQQAALPELDTKLGTASARCSGGVLIVGTGTIERRWKWTGQGLATVGLSDLRRNREWVHLTPADACDWSPPAAAGKLEGLVAEVSSDEGFTSEHLSVTATVVYPSAGLTVRYVIWAYPGAPGLRTQLSIKGRPEPSECPGDVVDRIPTSGKGLRRRAIGYYNDTQNRHTGATHLLREEIVDASMIDWASILCLEDDQSGVAMVKESHKCVNQPGAFTGGFHLGANGLSNTGMGFDGTHLREDRYRTAWATWLLVYGAGDSERELALKQFGRLRFPIQLERDMYIKADTWGSGDNSRESRDKGVEAEVLKEIDAVADLGLDGLQIDDGWQQSAASRSADPDGGVGWRPHPQTYPEGWQRVKEKAAARHIRLGLWAPAERISLEELKWNYDQVGFWTWKLDFATMDTPDKIERTTAKVREFISYTGHQAQMAWDVTEQTPRYGYFWAREYGCMWLSNRKPNCPERVIAKPWLMLRENWELATYVNLNKFQLPIQNFQRVSREHSDAYQHSHSYEVALGLVGVPVFFQTTCYYGDSAREEIRDLVARYKKHREAMFTSYVFPIGDEPSNASWTGFQWSHPDRDTGYLMIFRELNNGEQEKRMALRFLADTSINLLDIRQEQETTLEIDHHGEGLFSIENPGDFLFCRYQQKR